MVSWLGRKVASVADEVPPWTESLSKTCVRRRVQRRLVGKTRMGGERCCSRAIVRASLFLEMDLGRDGPGCGRSGGSPVMSFGGG